MSLINRTSTDSGLSTPSPSTMAVASSGSAPTQLVVPAITITSVPAATDSLQSMLNWLLIMMGVLLALTIGLILAVIYLFKKVGKT